MFPDRRVQVVADALGRRLRRGPGKLNLLRRAVDEEDPRDATGVFLCPRIARAHVSVFQSKVFEAIPSGARASARLAGSRALEHSLEFRAQSIAQTAPGLRVDDQSSTVHINFA